MLIDPLNSFKSDYGFWTCTYLFGLNDNNKNVYSINANEELLMI